MRNRNNPPANELLGTSKPATSRRIRAVIYVSVCFLSSIVPVVLDVFNIPPLQDQGGAALVVSALIGLLLLAILTFPTGIAGALFWWAIVIWPGTAIVTPAEALVLLSPVFVIGGYLQWFVWVPQIVLRNSRTPVIASTTKVVSGNGPLEPS